MLAVSLSCQCGSEHFGRTIHSYPIPFPGETLSGFGAQIRTFLFGQTISQAAAAADDDDEVMLNVLRCQLTY